MMSRIISAMSPPSPRAAAKAVDHRRTHAPSKALLAMLLALATSGCGQKGPLTLPAPPGAASAASAASAAPTAPAPTPR